MRGWLLAGSLYAIAAGILTQAILAGFFLSGTSQARMTHVILGAVLPYVAILPTASSWRRSAAGLIPRGVAVGSTVLLIGLWAQEALGHMPFPITTIVHVPLGVLLFWLSFHLAMSSSVEDAKADVGRITS